MRSLAAAVDSTPLSTAARLASICASTCARNSFKAAPTDRFSSEEAGFSQLSVTSVITPDLRPSHASRNALKDASSVARAASASNRERISAKRDCRPSAELMPRAARVCESFESGVDMGCDKNISQGRGCAPCERKDGVKQIPHPRKARARDDNHAALLQSRGRGKPRPYKVRRAKLSWPRAWRFAWERRP